MQDFMFREWFVNRRFRLVGVTLPADQSNGLYALIQRYGRLVILKTIFHKNRIACTWGRCCEQCESVNYMLETRLA